MRIIAVSTLKAFWNGNLEYRDAERPVLAWYRDVLRADWSSLGDVKAQLRNASILRDESAVFNIGGNNYRIILWINYPYHVVHIRFIGTHVQYDAIDAQTI